MNNSPVMLSMVALTIGITEYIKNAQVKHYINPRQPFFFPSRQLYFLIVPF